MTRGWTKILLNAAVPLLLAPVPSIAEAQCVLCRYSESKARDTCQPSTSGGNECSTDWDPQWGWSCWADGICSSTTMQVDGTPAVFEGLALGPVDAKTEAALEAPPGEGISTNRRARTLRSCDGAVMERLYAAEMQAAMRDRSRTFRI